MQSGRWVLLLVAALAAALAGCRDSHLPDAAEGKHTAVLGGYGPGPQPPPPPALLDAQGHPIPLPPVPAGTAIAAVRSSPDAALAAWVQGGQVVAAAHAAAGGWSPPQPLEQIYGQASDPQLASNGQGSAMAVWRHTVGSIQSLRFSRYTSDAGWSTPDVLPGAMPRPDAQGGTAAQDAPRLQMDAAGNVTAQWPSGFDASETQIARYVAGQGWSRAVSERLASAQPASPARPSASSARSPAPARPAAGPPST